MKKERGSHLANMFSMIYEENKITDLMMKNMYMSSMNLASFVTREYIYWQRSWIIRIYHVSDGGIEKSVQRIAIWYHEDCPVMTNGDPEGQVFSILPSHE